MAGRRGKGRANNTSPSTSATTSTPSQSYLYQSAPKSATPSQPDRSGPKQPTLYDMAAEREAALRQDAARASANAAPQEERYILGIPVPASTTSAAAVFSARAGESPGESAGTAFLYALSLSMVHFTLDVAVHHQYAQEIDWTGIGTQFALAVPCFFVIVYVAHAFSPGDSALWVHAKQGAFAAAAVATGCRLVVMGNREPYYAVMEMAPGLGAVLLWCVVEMKLAWAVASLAAVGAYTWWSGLSVF